MAQQVTLPLVDNVEYDMKELLKRITKNRLQLMTTKGTAFFSALLANLKVQVTTEGPSTASTNGVWMKFNPTFIHPLPLDELLGLMLHEVLHVAFGHCDVITYGHLNHEVLGIAMDHYINLFITRLGFKLPPGGYCDAQYRGMSTMQIYNRLMKDDPNQKMKGTCPHDVVLVPDPGQSEQEHRETTISNVIKAIQQADLAKQSGSVPGDIRRLVEDIISPQLPWNLILQNYMSEYNKDDYSWSWPNRRYLPDFYLPGLHSMKIGQLTAGADVSGSMSQDDLNEVIAEVRYIWDMMAPTMMRLQTFDTKVHLNKMYVEGDDLDELELKGGGGTNVQPLLDSIREECPLFALIFTDGYFSTPNMDGIYTDVYWIIKGNPNFTAPHGTVIHFDRH